LNTPITRKIFDGSLLVFALLALAAGLAVWFWKGPVAFDRAIDDAWDLFQFIMPRVGAAVLIAAFLQLLIPREVVSRLIGDQAGIKSVVIATIAGALTPGGPLTSFSNRRCSLCFWSKQGSIGGLHICVGNDWFSENFGLGTPSHGRGIHGNSSGGECLAANHLRNCRSLPTNQNQSTREKLVLWTVEAAQQLQF